MGVVERFWGCLCLRLGWVWLHLVMLFCCLMGLLVGLLRLRCWLAVDLCC